MVTTEGQQPPWLRATPPFGVTRHADLSINTVILTLLNTTSNKCKLIRKQKLVVGDKGELGLKKSWYRKSTLWTERQEVIFHEKNYLR